MRRLTILFSALALIVLATGCTTRIVDFTAISTKNLDIKGQRLERVEGRDVKHIIFVIPTGRPSMKEAIDRALEKADADILIDGVVYTRYWYIPYIYGKQTVIVEGTPVRIRPRTP